MPCQLQPCQLQPCQLQPRQLQPQRPPWTPSRCTRVRPESDNLTSGTPSGPITPYQGTPSCTPRPASAQAEEGRTLLLYLMDLACSCTALDLPRPGPAPGLTPILLKTEG